MNVKSSGRFLGLFLLTLAVLPALPAKDKPGWWPVEIDQALSRAGKNRAELEKALRAVPPDQRRALAFLVVNMPERDLESLSADFLLENVQLAEQARKQAPWGRRVPEEIYLNDVLPYANVDEERHPWRKQLHELCWPLVKDCKTAAEAAQRLNTTIFPKLKVRYSTERKKPHQSPKESIEQGKASCTGLAILLVDACRSVGVPARVVGTPLWVSLRGNHTWVEIWDGDWHFTGAAEPDPRGLDRGWFVPEASQAKKDSRAHAIYAASFRKTRVTFPLVWAPDRKDVYAENVTGRYARAAKPTRPEAKSPLSAEQRARIEKAAREYFAAPADRQAHWRFDAPLDRWLADHEEAVRAVVWKAYQAAPVHAGQKKDFDKQQVRHEKHLSPYTVKKVGKRPPQGWPLVIALHGGGGAPKEVNDQQWRVMQIYYRDQPSVTGYQYLALRAPNDTWNGFYADYVLTLVDNLVRQFLLFGDVDPDRVYLMGYSHGGYGAFFIGPKIPDRFAAVHSSAAAPTDGTISPRTLRNTRFTFMIGEHDTMYGRRARCEAFDAAIRKLKEQARDDFPVEMEFRKGHGHGGLPDRDKIKDLARFTRNPVPRRLSWDLTDPVVKHFFWLSVPDAKKGMRIDAEVHDNAVRITTRGVKHFNLDLDSRLVAYDRPVRITLNGKVRAVPVKPRFADLCRSLRERGDPRLAFACRVPLVPD